MYNKDIELEKIKKYLDDSSCFFDSDKETYKILKSCTDKEMQAEQVLDNLIKIGGIKEYPEFLKSFYDKTFKALEHLQEKDKEIEDKGRARQIQRDFNNHGIENKGALLAIILVLILTIIVLSIFIIIK